jgi:hypothetical protein
MAYSVQFVPSAADRFRALATSLQRQIAEELEREAEGVEANGDKPKRLRRMKVEDHRLVLLELHPTEQLLVLKIADPRDMHRRLHGEAAPQVSAPQGEAEEEQPAPGEQPGSGEPGTPPEAVEAGETPPAPEDPHEEDLAARAAAVQSQVADSRTRDRIGSRHEEPAGESTEPAGHAEKASGEKSSHAAPGESAEPDTETGGEPAEATPPPAPPQGPGLARLRQDFVEQAIQRAEELLASEEGPDATLARQWGVRIAGSAGAYGLPEMAELGRRLAEAGGEDAEEMEELIGRLLERARAAKLA